MINALGVLAPIGVFFFFVGMIGWDVYKTKKARREFEKRQAASYQNILANLRYIRAQYEENEGRCWNCSMEEIPGRATHYIAKGNCGFHVCKRHFDQRMGEHLGVEGYVS